MRHRIELTEQQKDEAALWLAKKTGGSLSDKESAQFDRWLNAAPNNRLAYDKARIIWAQLEAPTEKLAEATRFSGMGGRLRCWRGFSLAAGFAFAVYAGLWLVNPNLIQDLQSDVVAGQEIATAVPLPDGSEMILSARAAADIEFNNGQRLVKLLRGQAFFNVRHQENNAFIVESHNARVRVVGTEFNVNQWDLGTTVSVRNGIVEVSDHHKTTAARLTRGQEVTVKDGHLGNILPTDLDVVLSWMRGQVNVSDITLSALAVKLGKYSDGRILVLGPIAHKTISGTFPAEDVTDTLQTVATALNGSVLQVSPWLTVLY